jgi:hypothetical protein
MDRVLVTLLGVSVPIVITAIVFIYVYQHRKMLHKERLVMIEKGIAPAGEAFQEVPYPIQRKRMLTNGITTAAIGLALVIGLRTMGYGPFLLGGLIPLAVGLGQIISYLVTADDDKDE